jgi:ergothioneine biosynthesis protein EgtB
VSIEITSANKLADLKQAMGHCRAETLRIMNRIPPDLFYQQIHPEFSPIGWHFGHIAFTEALWLLPASLQEKFNLPTYQTLFRADGLPKEERCHLPDQESIQGYLTQVRAAVLEQLDQGEANFSERLGYWLLQHETQHGETIAFLSHLAGIEIGVNPYVHSSTSDRIPQIMIEIPAGGFWQGSDGILAQDNERPAHWVELDAFWLDQYPVTWGQYQQFMNQGGYDNATYWTAAGWQWREKHQITQPLHWSRFAASSPWENHPVYGVSAYEAEAYAKFVGKRLPTEAEWEKAARWSLSKEDQENVNERFCNCNAYLGQTTPVNHYADLAELRYAVRQNPLACQDLLGNVWEWTASTFAPYENFQPYPYAGYSQAYFDREHRVLRGGSWATRPWGLRASFRNWYHPWVRQILVGFRCAR